MRGFTVKRYEVVPSSHGAAFHWDGDQEIARFLAGPNGSHRQHLTSPSPLGYAHALRLSVPPRQAEQIGRFLDTSIWVRANDRQMLLALDYHNPQSAENRTKMGDHVFYAKYRNSIRASV